MPRFAVRVQPTPPQPSRIYSLNLGAVEVVLRALPALGQIPGVLISLILEYHSELPFELWRRAGGVLFDPCVSAAQSLGQVHPDLKQLDARVKSCVSADAQWVATCEGQLIGAGPKGAASGKRQTCPLPLHRPECSHVLALPLWALVLFAQWTCMT
jgi:hypothetical protein